MRSKPTRFAALASASLITATAVAGGLSPAAASGSPYDDSHKGDRGDYKHAKTRLLVKKDAKTWFTRTYKWEIDKKADKDKVFVHKGEKAKVNYEVGLKPSYTDSGWKVAGKIWVKNPSYKHSAKVLGVKDVLLPDRQEARVKCEVSFPYRLRPGDDFKCVYFAALADGQPRKNVAVAYTSRWSKVGTGSGYAPVEFKHPTKTVDRCVSVWDSRKGPLGKVCADEALTPFRYHLYLEAEKHGANWFKNVAAFKTEDTRTVGYDKWLVKVIEVGKPCDEPEKEWGDKDEGSPEHCHT